MNRILSLMVVIVSSNLAGCAGIVKSDVTVFHAPELAQSGKAYAFVPLKGQAGNLEYVTYRDLVRQQLSKHDYHLVPLAKADYAVALQYSVDSGRQVVESMPVYGQTGVSSSTTSGTMTSLGGFGTYSGTTTYTPTYGIVGSTHVTQTEYGRTFALYIVDRRSLKTAKPKILYQGKVTSDGSSSQLAKVMPAMIKALFKKFPDQSGDTRTEYVPIELKSLP